MDDPAGCPSCVADDSTKARGGSRGHLRSIQPPTPSPYGEEHDDKLAVQANDWGDDPQGPGPTLLAW
jgi:hypothetical protein